METKNQLVKSKLSILIPKIKDAWDYLEIEQKILRKEELELLLAEPNVWDNPEKASKLTQEFNSLAIEIDDLNRLMNLESLCLSMISLNDEEFTTEALKFVNNAEEEINKIEFKRMFNKETDKNNCFIEIQAGSGGVESQDFAEMLLRMYLRYCSIKNFETDVDIQKGDVAGIKSATIYVKGLYATGFLRTEAGVHRLVRKSPFDANNKRHTSFAAVDVYPEVDENISIEINPSDVREDTYRSSGAGGQHVNKTDSAIRLTHIPTGIVVTCQNGRSQHQNRATAWQNLKSKLYDLELKN